LSVKPEAAAEEIAAARDVLLAKYAPHAAKGDRDAVRLVAAVDEASATLIDPMKRAAYDAMLVTVNVPPTDDRVKIVDSSLDKGNSNARANTLPAPVEALAPAPQALVMNQPSSPQQPQPSGEAEPPAPVVFFLLILDWLARRVFQLRPSGSQSGELLSGEELALALPAVDTVKVGAADWQFTVHDAFHAPALAVNGQRLAASGQWLLVRLAIRNDWTGHRALRAEDFGLMVIRQTSKVTETSEVYYAPLHAEATHAARLTLGMRATPAGRYGLGFAAYETKETVVVFDLPNDASEAYLKLKPAGTIVDLSSVAPLPMLGMGPSTRGMLEGGPKAAQLAPPAPRLEIVDVNLVPGPGRMQQATVTARATPGTVCRIHVQYARGRSNARGLGPAVAGPDGLVRWSWRISSRTRPGEWPVTVVSGYNHALATLVVDARLEK